MECPFEKKYPSYLIKNDLFFMQLAYNQALEGWKKGEVPVGAVISYKNEVIAAAHNLVETSKDPTAHAEIIAISQASKKLNDWRLNQACLFVTKEPCPMCAGACILARFERVVYAFKDPKFGALGGAFSTHQQSGINHKLTVEDGLMQKECKAIMQTFFSIKRQQNRTFDQT